jgi:hypothetical protein
MFGKMKSREQGDFGERAAVIWLLGNGANVAYPFGHSPDWDLIAEFDGRLHRVQVKTSTFASRGRWQVQLATRGGNQSWNGTIKRLDASRCDYLFALVGDGRQWFIPAEALGGGSTILLGGPKYAAFEVAPGSPLQSGAAGGMPERSKGSRCKRDGYAYAGSNPAPPTGAVIELFPRRGDPR